MLVIPAGCLCSWSQHGSRFGEDIDFTLKYINSACPLHYHVIKAA